VAIDRNIGKGGASGGVKQPDRGKHICCSPSAR
jgi:hypothetical protein